MIVESQSMLLCCGGSLAVTPSQYIPFNSDHVYALLALQSTMGLSKMYKILRFENAGMYCLDHMSLV